MGGPKTRGPGTPTTQKSGTKGPFAKSIGEGPGVLVNSVREQVAWPPCPNPSPIGGRECFGPTRWFKESVRPAMGLQMGARLPLISQDLPRPGPWECQQQVVSKPEIIKGVSRIDVILGSASDSRGLGPALKSRGGITKPPAPPGLVGMQQTCVDRMNE